MCHFIQNKFFETKNFVFNLPSNESRQEQKYFHIKNYLLEMTPLQGKMSSKTPPKKRTFFMARAT